MRHRRRGSTLLELLVVAAILGTLTALLMPALVEMRSRANRTKCGNNLRQIALGAIQYADDKRFLPHVGKITALDGDYTSNTAARCVRSLVYFNYLDNPQDFVCPDANDEPAHLTQIQKMDLHKWSWKADTASVGSASPVAEPEPNDRALDDQAMTSLSYGWTRRGYTTNTISSNLLAADKSRRQGEGEWSSHEETGQHHKGPMIGNHRDCMIAVAVDGHTQRLAPTTDSMTTGSTSPSISGVANNADGYLGVLADE